MALLSAACFAAMREVATSGRANDLLLLWSLMLYRPLCWWNGTADPFSFLVVMTERHAFLGRIATGRVHSGSVAVGDRIKVLWKDGEL